MPRLHNSDGSLNNRAHNLRIITLLAANTIWAMAADFFGSRLSDLYTNAIQATSGTWRDVETTDLCQQQGFDSPYNCYDKWCTGILDGAVQYGGTALNITGLTDRLTSYKLENQGNIIAGATVFPAIIICLTSLYAYSRQGKKLLLALQLACLTAVSTYHNFFKIDIFIHALIATYSQIKNDAVTTRFIIVVCDQSIANNYWDQFFVPYGGATSQGHITPTTLIIMNAVSFFLTLVCVYILRPRTPKPPFTLPSCKTLQPHASIVNKIEELYLSTKRKEPIYDDKLANPDNSKPDASLICSISKELLQNPIKLRTTNGHHFFFEQQSLKNHITAFGLTNPLNRTPFALEDVSASDNKQNDVRLFILAHVLPNLTKKELASFQVIKGFAEYCKQEEADNNDVVIDVANENSDDSDADEKTQLLPKKM